MRRGFIVGSCLVVTIGALVTVAVVTACTEDVPYFCCTTQAACDRNNGGGVITPCLPRYPDRPFCDNEGEYAPNGLGRQCIPDPFPDGGGPLCTSPADCHDPAHPACVDQHCVACAGASDCTATTPVCSPLNECVGCGAESDCAGHASTPHCGVAGACVECRTGADCSANDNEPACDMGTGTCRACRADSECASDVCDLGAGKCIAETDIAYVDGTTGVGTGSCTKAMPCKTIQLGVDVASPSRSWVHVAPGSYADKVSIAAKSLQIVARGVELAPLGGPGITVKGAATVSIEGIRVRDVGGGINGDGIRCTDDSGTPTLSLQGIQIDGCSAKGINATQCNLSIGRSRVFLNAGGGISTVSSDVHVTNNFIAKNGNDVSPFGGVLISGAGVSGTVDVQFNTIISNHSVGGVASGVQCTGAASTVAKNSIVFDNVVVGANQVSGNCGWAFSDIGPQAQSGTGNINTAPAFVNASNNDYHLQSSSAGVDLADPGAVENIDIDGDMRPANNRSDMGADEVP